MQEILDAKLDRRRKDVNGKKGALRYLIKWTKSDDPSWDSYTSVTGCPELLARFHGKRPDIEMPAASSRMGRPP